MALMPALIPSVLGKSSESKSLLAKLPQAWPGWPVLSDFAEENRRGKRASVRILIAVLEQALSKFTHPPMYPGDMAFDCSSLLS